MRRTATVVVLAALVGAALVAGLVEAQPGIGFSKSPPLSGNGSSGSPLKIDVCAAGSGYISNGTALTCTASQQRVTTDCGAGSAMRSIGSNGAAVCIAVGGGGTGDIDGVTTAAPLTGGCTTGTCALTTSIATSRFVGRTTAGTGVMEELTGTQATTLLDAFTSGLKGLAPASGGGTTNYLRADGSWTAPPGAGDVTDIVTTSPMAIGTTQGATCSSGSCTVALRAANTSRIFGRVTAGAGNAEELTGTQATTLLDAFTSGLKGLAPASGGGTTNFLRADGTWAAPAGLSGGTNNFVARWTGASSLSTGQIFDDNTNEVKVGGGADAASRVDAVLLATLNGDTGAYVRDSANDRELGLWTGGGGGFIGTSTAHDLFLMRSATAKVGITGVGLESYDDSYLGNSNTNQTRIFGRTYYLGTAPTLSGCAVCTMESYSTDARGTVTCTDGPAACTVTFSVAYATNPPACVVSSTTTTAPRLTSAPTTSAFTFTAFPAGGGTLNYHCDGML